MNNNESYTNDYYISDDLLKLFDNNNIVLAQHIIDDCIDDSDILSYALRNFNEEECMNVLKYVNDDNIHAHEFDDEDELRDFLFTEHIILDINCDLTPIAERIDYIK